MTNSLKGKVALVTGETTGISRESAIVFASAGAKVVVSGRESEKGKETVRLIEQEGGEATTVKTFSNGVNTKTKPSVAYIVEHTFGCKWMFSILCLLRTGVNRPGILTRSVDGLSSKVLNKQLAKLVDFGIISKTIYPEIPPHVEYKFTEFGLHFIKILDTIDELEKFRHHQQD
jgi:DNA-binding HxlR family transcriptional regulator